MIFEIDEDDKSFKLMEELAQKALSDPKIIKQMAIDKKNHQVYLKGQRLLRKYLIKNWDKGE